MSLLSIMIFIIIIIIIILIIVFILNITSNTIIILYNFGSFIYARHCVTLSAAPPSYFRGFTLIALKENREGDKEEDHAGTFQWFSECGLWTSSINTIWELVRNGRSQASPRPSESEALRVGLPQPVFQQALRVNPIPTRV
ncbi:hypothetical protein J1605_014269 [Eschrichtius robustus]|uniref:Uncharacterized protein n=1 Tax=Eschrichtius robustus TaxID=9764 RepID=A0AB34GD59_ESCRO|nr:hypothetical protein J1605_014269 [Eschrichtius robustus]